MATPLSVKIRNLRIAKGLNQTEFGKLMGVRQATVSRWEDDATPEPAALAQLAEMAGESVLEFMGQQGRAPRSNAPPIHLASNQVFLPVTLPSSEVLAEALMSILDAALEAPGLEERARRLAQSFPSALRAALLPQRPQDDDEANTGEAPPHVGGEGRSSSAQ